MYAIKDTTDNKRFCGFHEYVSTWDNGIERWNDTFH